MVLTSPDTRPWYLIGSDSIKIFVLLPIDILTFPTTICSLICRFFFNRLKFYQTNLVSLFYWATSLCWPWIYTVWPQLSLLVRHSCNIRVDLTFKTRLISFWISLWNGKIYFATTLQNWYFIYVQYVKTSVRPPLILLFVKQQNNPSFGERY